LEFLQFFFVELRKLETRYFGDSDSEDEDSSEDDGEAPKEETKSNEDAWYHFTTSFVLVAQELNIPVAEIGAMPYQKFLFWQNYLRIKQQRSTINNGQS
jgi:hypothetical protein